MADALAPQAEANDRQQRNIRSSIDLEWTLLKNCENQFCPEPANMTVPPADNGDKGKKSFFDSVFRGVSIGVGVGGSTSHEAGQGRGREQPQQQQPPQQSPPQQPPQGQ